MSGVEVGDIYIYIYTCINTALYIYMYSRIATIMAMVIRIVICLFNSVLDPVRIIKHVILS